MRRLRSIPLQIVIVVVLGLATTIAIAWMSAIYATGAHAPLVRGQLAVDSTMTSFFAVRSTTLLTEVYWRGSGQPNAKGPVNIDVLPQWSRARLPVASNRLWTSADPHSQWEIAYGLPMRSMVALFNSHVVTSRSGEQTATYLTEWAIALDPIQVSAQGRPALQSRALPLRFLPLGFAIDALLFTTAWYLLLFAVPTTRRLIRTRRGTCLKCGYGPLAAPDAVCPECGRVRGERQATRT